MLNMGCFSYAACMPLPSRSAAAADAVAGSVASLLSRTYITSVSVEFPVACIFSSMLLKILSMSFFQLKRFSFFLVYNTLLFFVLINHAL